MIKIEIFNVSPIITNCCLLTDEATGSMAVSDPGGSCDKLISRIKSTGSNLEYVLLTHGHYDHIGYAKQLADMFGAKIVTGEKNNEFLSNPRLNLSAKHGINLEPFSADILLDDGVKFMLGETEIKYISTPGHTSGCGSYIFDRTILSGDTLFCESYGRTDLPTGNDDEIICSLKKLKELEGDYNIIPGHGRLTTLEHERQYNPLMKML